MADPTYPNGGPEVKIVQIQTHGFEIRTLDDINVYGGFATKQQAIDEAKALGLKIVKKDYWY